MGCGSSKNNFVRDGGKYGRDDGRSENNNNKNNAKEKKGFNNGNIGPITPEKEVAEQYRKTIYDLRQQAITQGLMSAEYEWCGRSESDHDIRCVRSTDFFEEPEFDKNGYDLRYHKEVCVRDDETDEDNDRNTTVVAYNSESSSLNLQSTSKNETKRSLFTNGRRKLRKRIKNRKVKREQVGKNDEEVEVEEEEKIIKNTNINEQSQCNKQSDFNNKDIIIYDIPCMPSVKELDDIYFNESDNNDTTRILPVTLSDSSLTNDSNSKGNCFWRDELVAEKKQVKFFKNLEANKKKRKSAKKATVATRAEVKQNLLTIFLCRQLLNEKEIGKGMYSDVYLADMTVIPAVRPSTIQDVITSISQAECIKNECSENESCSLEEQACCCQNQHEEKQEQQIQCTQQSENNNNKKKNKDDKLTQLQNNTNEQTESNVNIIPHKARNEVQSSENNLSNINKNNNTSFIMNAASMAQTVCSKAADACPPHRHYLICVREMYLHKYQENPRFVNDVVQELSEWQRLNTFNNRLLRCIGAEIVNGDRFTPSKIKWPAVMKKNMEKNEFFFSNLRLEREKDHGELLESWMSTKEKQLMSSEAAKEKSYVAKSGQRVCKLRVYTEFAKHGTLRSFQTREMPKRFGKNYLHELTARALMREVLLGLLQVHESFALQYDLNASNVYLSHPMQAVYKTLFPAYISDIPVGSLFQMQPRYIGNLLLEQQESMLANGQHAWKRGKLARDAHLFKNRSEIAVAPLNRSSLGSDLQAKEDNANELQNNNNNNIADATTQEQKVNKNTELVNVQAAGSGKENTLGLTESHNLSAIQVCEFSTTVLDAKDSTAFASSTELGYSSSLHNVNSGDISNSNAVVNNNNKEDDLVSQNTVLNEDDDVFWQSAHARKYFTEHGYESDSLFAPSMNNSWPGVNSENNWNKPRYCRYITYKDNKYANDLEWRAMLTHNDHEKVISLKPNDMPLRCSLQELISPSISPCEKKGFPFSFPRPKIKPKVKRDSNKLKHTSNHNGVDNMAVYTEKPLQGVVFIASQRLPSYFVQKPDIINNSNNAKNNKESITSGNNTTEIKKKNATWTSKTEKAAVPIEKTNKYNYVDKTNMVNGSSNNAAMTSNSNQNQCRKTEKISRDDDVDGDETNTVCKNEYSSVEGPHRSLQPSSALMSTSLEYSTQPYSRRGSKSENGTSLGISRCNELCSLPSYLPLLLEDSIAEANTQKAIVAGKLVQNIIKASNVSTATAAAVAPPSTVTALHLSKHLPHLQTHQEELKREEVQSPMHVRQKENVNKLNKHKNKGVVKNAKVSIADPPVPASVPAQPVESLKTTTPSLQHESESSTSQVHFNESIIQGTWRANEHSNRNNSNVHYRHRHPVVKLNYTTLLKRVLARTEKQTDSTHVPLHRFMRITHAAPEVILNHEFSEASDVYAFAMMFIELCTPNGEILSECEPNVNVASSPHAHRSPEIEELAISRAREQEEEEEQHHQHQQQQLLFMNMVNPPNEYVERKEYEKQRAANVKAWYKSQLEHYNERQKSNIQNNNNSAVSVNGSISNVTANTGNAQTRNNVLTATETRTVTTMRRPNDSMTARNMYALRNTFKKEDSFGKNYDLSGYLVDPYKENTNDDVNTDHTRNVNNCNNENSGGCNGYDRSFFVNELNWRGSGASFSGTVDDLVELDYMQHCLVPIPSHLSSECKQMLARCLHVNPAKRPSVAELLRCPYFLFGHWIQHSVEEVNEFHANALRDAELQSAQERFNELHEHGTQMLTLSFERTMPNTSQVEQENINGVEDNNIINNNGDTLAEGNQNRQTVNVNNTYNFNSASRISTVSWANSPAELDYRRMPEVPWNGDVDYIRIGRTAGLPVIPKKQKKRRESNLSKYEREKGKSIKA